MNNNIDEILVKTDSLNITQDEPIQLNVSEQSGTVTVSNVYEDYRNKTKILKLKSFFKGKYSVITVVLFMITISVISTICVMNKTVAYEDTKQENSLTEVATEKVVLSTDETLKFTKAEYTVEVGEKVEVSYEYTQPDDNTNYSEPNITYSSNNIDIAIVDKSGNVTGKKTGTTSIVAVSETGIYATVPITVTAPNSHIIQDVPYIYQGDEYPSGCESVSSTMLLQYYGFDIQVNEFIDDYLTKSELQVDEDGQLCGADAWTSFLGNPYSEDALGCYPNVIKKAMNKYFEDKNYRAVDVTGSSMEYLINNYIANNKPVVIWATMFMNSPVVTYEWKVTDADEDSPYNDGDTYQWLANEHCMLLVGYDEDYYYFNDPLSSANTAYEKEIFEERFAQMGRCALIIDKTI